LPALQDYERLPLHEPSTSAWTDDTCFEDRVVRAERRLDPNGETQIPPTLSHFLGAAEVGVEVRRRPELSDRRLRRPRAFERAGVLSLVPYATELDGPRTQRDPSSPSRDQLTAVVDELHS